MNILFLDDNDCRTRKFKSHVPCCTSAKTSSEMIRLLSTQDRTVDVLFLDHDLGGGTQDTGMEVVRWMVENRPAVNLVVVHTLNHCAGTSMVAKLMDVGYVVDRVPFTSFDYERISAVCSTPEGIN